MVSSLIEFLSCVDIELRRRVAQSYQTISGWANGWSIKDSSMSTHYPHFFFSAIETDKSNSKTREKKGSTIIKKYYQCIACHSWNKYNWGPSTVFPFADEGCRPSQASPLISIIIIIVFLLLSSLLLLLLLLFHLWQCIPPSSFMVEAT